MSTQINVTVDRGGLLQRNQQQTTANRQARLEADGTAAAAAEGQAQRAAARTATGLDANGNPLAKPQAINRVKEEPAAFRNVAKTIYFGPKHPPYIELDYDYGSQISLNYYFLINTTKVKIAANTSAGLLVGRSYMKGYELINTGSGEINRSSFEPSAGPGGANAIKLLATRSSGLSVIDDGRIQPEIPGDENYFYDSKLTFEGFVKTEFGADSDYTSFWLWLDGFRLEIDNDNTSVFRVYPSAGGPAVSHSLNINATSLTAWTHLAVVMSNSTYKVFVAGNLVGAFDAGASQAYMLFKRFDLGTTNQGSGQTDVLWLSSLRISKGARYSGNSFTPPTSIR